jgi:hypothetical protein
MINFSYLLAKDILVDVASEDGVTLQVNEKSPKAI